MKSASEIQNLDEQQLDLEFQAVRDRKRKLNHEIDQLDTYLVGLKEEFRRRQQKLSYDSK